MLFVSVEPGAGIRAGGLAAVALFKGIVICCLHKSRRNAASSELLGNKCMDNVHYLASDDIGKVGLIAFCLHFEAPGRLVVSNLRVHDTICFRKGTAPSVTGQKSKDMPLFLKGLVGI